MQTSQTSLLLTEKISGDNFTSWFVDEIRLKKLLESVRLLKWDGICRFGKRIWQPRPSLSKLTSITHGRPKKSFCPFDETIPWLIKKQITIPKSKSDHNSVHHFQNETSIEHLNDKEHLDDKDDQMKKGEIIFCSSKHLHRTESISLSR